MIKLAEKDLLFLGGKREREKEHIFGGDKLGGGEINDIKSGSTECLCSVLPWCLCLISTICQSIGHFGL